MEHTLHYQNITYCPLCQGKNLQTKKIPIKEYRLGNLLFHTPTTGIFLHFCQTCQLAFKSPHPNPKTVIKLLTELGPKVWKEKKTQSATPRILSLKRTLQTSTPPTKPKHLDIGASHGSLLQTLTPFTSLQSALDLIEYPQCRKKITGEYLLTALENPQLQANYTYDLITVFDVLEHLTDAKQAFKNLNTLLAPNGILILETGNTDALKPSPEHSYYTHLFEHTLFWNLNSLHFACKKHNLQIEKIQKVNHKDRENLPLLKKLAILTLNLIIKIPKTQNAIQKLSHGNPLRFGNPWEKDHILAHIRKKS